MGGRKISRQENIRMNAEATVLTLQGDARQHKTQAALAGRAGDHAAAQRHSEAADKAVAAIMHRGRQ